MKEMTLSEIVKAWTDGAIIQRSYKFQTWCDMPSFEDVVNKGKAVEFDGENDVRYRIKPTEPILRPYTAEEFNDLMLNGKAPYVKDNDINFTCIIRAYENDRLWLGVNDYGITLADATEKLTWANGDPFGVMEGE